MAQIKRDREADHPDADHLERVGRPPGGIHGREVNSPYRAPISHTMPTHTMRSAYLRVSR